MTLVEVELNNAKFTARLRSVVTLGLLTTPLVP